MEQLTRDQAIAFHDAGTWRQMNAQQKALFQMQQDCLCMPFSEFHQAVEGALGRPVFTHEFGLNRDGLLSELKGLCDTPTFEQVLALLPADKTIVVAA